MRSPEEINIDFEMMSKVFMDSADPILIEDLEGHVIEMNKEAEDVYGWSRSELLGKPIKTIVPPERHGQADELLASCKAGEEVRNIEGLRWMKSGKIIPVLLTLSLLKDGNDQPVAIATIAKDLSGIKRAENELQQMSKVFMDSVDPILIEDLDGNVIDLNRAAEETYGWSRGQLLGRPIKTIVPPERHAQADELLSRCKAGEEVRNIEGLRWTIDGEIIPVLLTLSALKDEEGTPTAIATIAKDISDAKKAEEELGRMAKVFRDAADPIMIEDLDGKVIDMNKVAEEAYGWTKEQLKGKPIKVIVPPERHGQADELLARCKAGDDVRNIEGLRWSRDGRIIPVLLTLSLLKDQSGQATSIATIAKDISDLKEAEDEIHTIQDVTMESMGTLAEYRDPETGGHIKRTRDYVRLLAIHLKTHPRFKDVLDDETIESLYKSAPLHDIGKVGVPDDILLKPGKLNAEEFEEMKKHTVYGRETIAIQEKKVGFDSFLHFADEIAATHHEKWDGTGYPNGLKGDEIPISGRLMALADVYDALISRRVYKPPFSHNKAVEIIKDGRGSHFDPDVVDAFLELEDAFRKTALKFADYEEEKELLSKNDT